MKTRAAVVESHGAEWSILELDLEAPRTGEVLVRWEYAGLCLSDEHNRAGTWTNEFPNVGGHEGAGVVEAVGPGVMRLRPGDHVVASFVPVCGYCRWCASGQSTLCVEAGPANVGRLPDGTFRFRLDGRDYGTYGGVATFAERSVVAQGSAVRIDPSIPLELAALASCSVLTGWGAVMRAGSLLPGETVIVIGAGGIGLNAVMAAATGGAAAVIAVDTLARKRDFALEVGATHAVASAQEAREIAVSLRPDVGGADLAVVATSVLDAKIGRAAFDAIGRHGRVILAAVAVGDVTLEFPAGALVGDQKRVIGTMYGSTNPHADIPAVLDLATAGRLPLRRLISETYALDDIRTGYRDLRAGTNIRGLIRHGTGAS
jgi:S-(hydroxymethyl)glutathione dehydrogenase/alcohol dehydrogenase